MTDDSTDVIRNPHFTCMNCGFANVQLTDDGALCTECGTEYKI